MVEREESFVASIDEAIARNVRTARERAGLSQGDLAARLSDIGVPGFHQTTIARIERGERVLRLAEAIAMARVLEYRVEDLVESADVAGLRAEYELLNRASRDYLDAAIALTRQRVNVAEQMDHHFPDPDGLPVGVDPELYEMMLELLLDNSNPRVILDQMTRNFLAATGRADNSLQGESRTAQVLRQISAHDG